MLLPFTPLFAALSASSPIFKGKIADIDLRWKVISQSVDCRTEDERNPASQGFIPKSRYSTTNHYISNHQYVKDVYFDTPQYKVDPENFKQLKEKGIDDRLAFHIASLFVRDPIPTYDYEHSTEGEFNPRDSTAHFENLQSSNWNSMRFKPPPSLKSPIGWRVEFRTMDIQLTDFENSALIVLLGMVNNIINYFDIDFIMPISMIDENMERAHKRNAIFKEKFLFKINILPTGKCYKHNILEQSDYIHSNKNVIPQDADVVDTSPVECKIDENNHYVVEELYLWEILVGKPEIKYKGIYPLIEEYLIDRKYGAEIIE
jgi:glutamate--cysteine ligase catalytic subunit